MNDEYVQCSLLIVIRPARLSEADRGERRLFYVSTGTHVAIKGSRVFDKDTEMDRTPTFVPQ